MTIRVEIRQQRTESADTHNDIENHTDKSDGETIWATDRREAVEWAAALLSEPTRCWWSYTSAQSAAPDIVAPIQRIADLANRMGLDADDFGIVIRTSMDPQRGETVLDIITSGRIPIPGCPTLGPNVLELGARVRTPRDQAELVALFDPTQCVRLRGLRILDRKD